MPRTASAARPIWIALLTVVASAPAPADTCPEAGLISHWPADADANDAFGTNHGTFKNDAWIGEGVEGNAFHFGGVAGHVDLDVLPLTSGDEFSIAAWVWLDEKRDCGFFSTQDAIFGQQTRGVGIGIRKTAQWGINADALVLATGRTEWAWSIWSSPTGTVTGTGRWYHVAAVLTGATSATPAVSFYVDGVHYTGTPWEGGAKAVNYGTNPDAARIGGIYSASSPGYSECYFKGRVDGLRIYATALSAVDVQALAAGCPAPAPPDDACQDELADAQNAIDALTAENAALEAQLGRIAASLALVEQDFRLRFRDPAFAIPGAAVEDRVESLTGAVIDLNPGRKLGVYVGLGGSPGRR